MVGKIESRFDLNSDFSVWRFYLKIWQFDFKIRPILFDLIEIIAIRFEKLRDLAQNRNSSPSLRTG